MMDVQRPLVSGLSDGVTFEQAVEIHRLFQEDFLSSTQIVNITGIPIAMVCGVLTGRYFPGALKSWELKL
jgi:hypothetical protein